MQLIAAILCSQKSREKLRSLVKQKETAYYIHQDKIK